ncbi:MAG: S9 family peptidase [Bacteroidales bacterium]|nr:S9 family peptidase [Bacteroidales bacterium]
MKKVIFLVILGLCSTSIVAQTQTVTISDWLTIPAQTVAYPVFHELENTQGKTFSDENLLNFEHINFSDHYPAINEVLAVLDGKQLRWAPVRADENGLIVLGSKSDVPQMAYLATYIWSDRWLQTTIEINSPYMLKAWLDGEEIGRKTKIDEDVEKIGKVSKNLKLERGKHLLIIKTLMPASKEFAWNLSASLEIKEAYEVPDIEISLDPANRKNIYHLMDGIKTTSTSLSHDGKYYTISYRQSLPPSDDSETWTEIRRFDNKQLVHSFRHARVSQIRWLPKSNRISYVASQKEKSTVYLFDLEKGEIKPLLQDMEKLAGYRWAPNEELLVYNIREEEDSKEPIMRHLAGMPDRQPGWRHRSFVYLYDLKSGMSQRLTWGNLTTSVHDISPDSKKILFSQHYPDFSERPYSKQNLFILDLATLALDTIWTNENWGIRAAFSPDGKFLLATGGPSAFNGAGLNIPEGTIPHNSDTQAYIYDLQNKTVKAFTREFNPSIESVHWHALDKYIYLLTEEEDYRRLYRYDLNREQFTLIETGVDYISNIGFADNELLAVYSGNPTNSYPSDYSINLKSLQVSALGSTETVNYRHVEFGETKNWDFTASTGVNIKGRVYYPPNFDPTKKYPVIVYYYGGINPVFRTFGGRYPFNLWAGNDYLVYVLQPSGAIGFGQEFSAAHVNNWGFTVADEIIEGTKKFLAAHAYADASKVGCAGASYGGFMTMLLLTRTDIFATAISHAGISSISSYWGEGYWGYSYSAEASAESFPWNNKDLYIGQSPLFHADKINTPLLLLTGDSDTNVPPGESIQMYTALKLLGRPVELVLVKGEDHHILTYSKRILWHNTIMAWWDKYLKGQDEWWEEQFPQKNF